MNFSVIIPMFNEAAHIGRTLHALNAAAAHHSGSVELLVVDNGSTDDSVKVAQQAGAKVLVCPNIRVGALRNRGAAIAQGEILAFVDADIEVPMDWFHTVEQAFADPSISGVGLIHLTPAAAPWFARVWADRLMSKREQACDLDALDTSNLSLRREVFESLGGFSEPLSSGEDKELTLRITRKGGRLRSLPSPAVWHWGYEKTWKEWMARESWRQGSHLDLIRTQGMSLRLLRFPLAALAHWPLLLGSLLALASGAGGLAMLLLLLNVLPGCALAAKNRKARQHPLLLLQLGFLHWLRLHIAGAAVALALVGRQPKRPSR